MPSLSPAASVCPSGLNATDSTAVVLVRLGPSGRGRVRSEMSHSRTVPSELLLASVCPSGLTVTRNVLLCTFTGSLRIALRPPWWAFRAQELL